jgi:hypothetical protein
MNIFDSHRVFRPQHAKKRLSGWVIGEAAMFSGMSLMAVKARLASIPPAYVHMGSGQASVGNEAPALASSKNGNRKSDVQLLLAHGTHIWTSPARRRFSPKNRVMKRGSSPPGE